MVGRLGSLLFAVQKMKLKRFPAESIKRLRVVGEGETFSVFEAKFQQEVIAVKRIRLYEKNASVSRTAVQRRLQAVLKEILIMNHPPLAHHSNIVRLLGYGWEIEQQQLSPFITVELAPAGSLRNYLRDSAKPFRTKEILASDIASGLMALHKCGIIHGDLKLDNVLVVPSLDRPCMATARIADFGHSIILNSATEADLHYFGTGR
ncbi:kinase-like domain-containing protein [Aspergillus carlsbadensis]|nr:kinase-like domain-containing protein [Aspergillus carlsbadensis]